MSKPRVVRRVTRYYKDAKTPKVARDRKSGYRIEAVLARGPHPCANRECAHGNPIGWSHKGMIMPNTPYAKVDGPRDIKRIGGRTIPDPKDYHFDCVPEGAKYLVRFFVR